VTSGAGEQNLVYLGCESESACRDDRPSTSESAYRDDCLSYVVSQ